MLDRRDVLAGAAAVFGEAAVGAPRAWAQADGPPSEVAALKIAGLVDLEEAARKRLGEGPFTFVAAGSGAQWTLAENRRAFDRYEIIPDYLAGRGPADPKTTLMGMELALPVFTCPMGAQALIHTSGEIGTAQGTAAAGTLYIMSGAATRTIEDIGKSSPGPKWYQLYMPVDLGVARERLQRARAAGFKAIVFTIDALGPGNSEALARTGFDVTGSMNRAQAATGAVGEKSAPTRRELSWNDVAFVQKESGLPVVLKGVLTADLARKAVERGIAAVEVSNHGGRQTDGLPGALDALPEVAQAVGGRIPVLMDGGVRRGVDVFKALALGARAVGVGRPMLYSLALGGNLGVKSAYDRLRAEVVSAMTGTGVDRIDEINARYVRRI